MNKYAVMISIQPKWVEKISNGEKTIEVRKTCPKIATPFKCYIYATKSGDRIILKNDKVYEISKSLTGKVVGEFICDKIAKLKFVEIGLTNVKIESDIPLDINETCLTGVEIGDYVYGNYLNGMLKPAKPFYGLHISDLKVYNTPKEITEFIRPFKYDGDGIICGTAEEMSNIAEWNCQTLFGEKYPDYSFENCDCKNCPKAKDFYRLKHPPESWCYVEAI